MQCSGFDEFLILSNNGQAAEKGPALFFASKGKGGASNKKNGNMYLSWAFAEAGELARRFDSKARAYYDRKRRRTNAPTAHSALSHKLARAAFYIMRDSSTGWLAA